jgi:polygalacturonase
MKTTTFSLLLLLLASEAPCMARYKCNILDYGAVGDSLTLNSKAINTAIEDCAAKGGGTVIIPEGKFLTGTISLKSDVSLYLMPGAEIKGTTDLSQYVPYVPADETRGPEHFRWNRALLLGDHVENVTIEGGGVINGDHVFDPKGEEGMRGPHTILFGDSRNIHIKGITINNAANYAFMAYQLDDAAFTDVKINAGWDGIHIRWGSNLKISKCRFHTGDDAIAGGYWENMEISDNEINSSCNGIRLIMPATNLTIERCHFFGDGKFEHRTSREKKRKNMLSAIILQPGGWGKAEGMMEDVLIRDVTIENVDNPLNIILNEGNNARGIRVEHLYATRINRSACSVESWKGGRYEDVTFRNIYIEFAGHYDPELLEIVPGQPHVDARPLPCWALYARCIDKLVLDSVEVRYTGMELRPAFIFDEIGTLDLNEVSYDGADRADPMVFRNVGEVNKKSSK